MDPHRQELFAMSSKTDTITKPLILAPAGNRTSFLAALAAGADAIYCGLKHFSARMEAMNFTVSELAGLAALARSKKVKVYIAFNSLVKPGELEKAGRLLEQSNRMIKPDGIIVQDLAFLQLAKQIKYTGELHLSTLANVSFPKALHLAKKNLDISKIVTPRELNIDEIKAMADTCPKGVGLEVFVHGALCYGVSGRCYWSSFLGGKSGLRGRCVQPCRRIYRQKEQRKRYFSCQDLSIDVLVKVLLQIPQISVWKIEGRKKGPHYVFYSVTGYRMLRDHGHDPQKKKTALAILAYALGRQGTHYNFLPQRPQNPINIKLQTGSGLLMGRTRGPKLKPYLVSRDNLFVGDLLRVGYEDEPWHHTCKVPRNIPKKGHFYLKLSAKTSPPEKGTPVFLIDRNEKELQEHLAGLEKELEKIPRPQGISSKFTTKLPARKKKRMKPFELSITRKQGRIRSRNHFGLWLASERNHLSKSLVSRCWWWLPPVIWPENEKQMEKSLQSVLKQGGCHFMLNAPWQIVLFKSLKGLNLWAGPFCNTANVLAIETLAALGFSGAIVSPELCRKDYLHLPKKSPLPLGIVIAGNWPLCISRTAPADLKAGQLFASPRGEQAWIMNYGEDFWVYPNWKIDLGAKKSELQRAGYSMFIHLNEPLPKKAKLKKRPGMWSWNIEDF